MTALTTAQVLQLRTLRGTYSRRSSTRSTALRGPAVLVLDDLHRV
jgi:hypothetical protein